MQEMKRVFLWLISLSSGILLWAAWPTGGFTPLIFIALLPLLWVEDYVLEQQQQQDRQGRESKSPRQFIFLYAFSAFLAWNVLATWWIWHSTPAAVLAFVANAALMAGTFSLFHYTCRHFFKNGLRWIILAVYWLGFEHFHHHWDLSWPWLTLGNAFATVPSWVQWYEITGPFGGSLWVLACNVALLELFKRWKAPERRRCAILAACIVFLPLAASLVRHATYREKGKPVEVVVVQPNIDPYTEQFNLSPVSATLRMLQLAQSRMTSQTRFIVTPESMIQEYVWEEELPYCSPSVRLIQSFLRDWPQARMIAGISSYTRVPAKDSARTGVRRRAGVSHPDFRFYKAHNTIIALGSDPRMPIPVHHKSRLTPGVEIMPFAGKLKFLEKMAINLGGTVGTLGVEEGPHVFACTASGPCLVKGGSYAGNPAARPAPLPASAPGFPGKGDSCIAFSDIICYESVFSDYVASCVNAGAELLFVSTNDGWWKDTPGHRQHAAYARLRAVENRRAIARSANTGISCFIDQKGKVWQATGYWEPACIRQTLLANEETTFYSKYGNILGKCCLPLSLFFLLLTFVYRIFPNAWQEARKRFPNPDSGPAKENTLP